MDNSHIFQNLVTLLNDFFQHNFLEKKKQLQFFSFQV